MRTLRLLLGSFLVYLFVACASAMTGDTPAVVSLDGSAPGSDQASDATILTSDSTSPAATSSPGQESGMMSAIVDALTDPVSTAKADPNTSGTRLKTQRYVGTKPPQLCTYIRSGARTEAPFTLERRRRAQQRRSGPPSSSIR